MTKITYSLRALILVSLLSISQISRAEAIINFDGLDAGPIASQQTQSKLLMGKWSSESKHFLVKDKNLVGGAGQHLILSPYGQDLVVKLNLTDGPLSELTQANGEMIINKPIYYAFTLKARNEVSGEGQAYMALSSDSGFFFAVGQMWGQKHYGCSEGPVSDILIDAKAKRFVVKLVRYEWGVQADIFVNPSNNVQEHLIEPDFKGWPAKRDGPAPILNKLSFKANASSWAIDAIQFGATFDSVLISDPTN